jgi:hypothetical protein
MSDWPTRWDASWVWWDAPGDAGPGDLDLPDQMGYIRHSFVLAEVPAAAPARACVNGRYVLYVNGHRVGQGPVRAEPQCLSYDEYDLAPWLRPGPNAIGLWCRHYGEAVAFWRPVKAMGEVGRGWCVFEARVGDAPVVATGGGWRAMAAPLDPSRPGLEGQPHAELVRGAEVPRGWRSADFDDSSWPAAKVLTWSGLGPPVASPPADPHPSFHRRALPQLPVERLGVPVALPAALAAGEVLTIDMGREVYGTPDLTVSSTAGAVIDLAVGEDVGTDGRPVILPRNWVMRYTAGGGRAEQVEAFDAVGFRYLSVQASAPAQVVDLAVSEALYPRPAGAWFRTSDPDLDALWEAGARTVDLCSTDAYIDCPGREQRAWLGDAYVHQMVSLAANPDTRLVRHNLRLHAQSRRPDGLLEMFAGGDIATYPYVIPDYSLHWIRAVAQSWRWLGDLDLLDELVPLATGIADWYERFRGPDGGITDVPGWVFIDWAQTERSRQTAALDALHVLAMSDLAVLHRARGDERAAVAADRRAARSRQAFADRYWDDARQVFVDAARPDGWRSARVSQHTNALAVLAGLVPGGVDGGAVIDVVLDPARVKVTKTPADSLDESVRGTFQWTAPEDFDEQTDVVAAQPYFAHFVHQAVAHAGRAHLIPGLVRRWLPHLVDGYGCFGEFWEAAPGAASRCHGWSATPTYDLTAHVAGVSPLAPGCSVVAVRPRLGPLASLDASVPVPAGFVRVVLRRDGEGGMGGWVEVPPGVEGRVELEDEWTAVVPPGGRLDVHRPVR